MASLVSGARAEIARIEEMGGAVASVESGYMKSAMVSAHSARRHRIETGEDIVVGLNRFTTTEPNPLTADLDTAVQTVDPQVESAACAAVQAWRAARDADPVRREAAVVAVARLREDAASGVNLVPATLDCVRAELTTGEWAQALRDQFGEYRAPTGVSGSVGVGAGGELAGVRTAVAETGAELGTHLRVLVGKPGLDGHSNGAEQVAVRARDAGFEVIYQGIRLTPAEIVAAAVAEDVHLVGLSILSGSHMSLVPDVLAGLAAAGLVDVPVVVGGIIPASDAAALMALGVAAVFTPKDFGLNEIMGEFVTLIRAAHGLPVQPALLLR